MAPANPIASTELKSTSTRGAVEQMQALVGADMTRVNETIVEKMQSPVALIPQLAGHLVASGGKRVRPMLTLASAALLGADMARAVRLAACVEFIHTATLLHDDVVDESKLRRGKDTANAVWGNQASVLVGDFLFSRAFELMVEDGSLEVLRILSNASSVIAEGEVLQLTTAGDLTTDTERYMAVISAKTAALFGAATEIVPVFHGASDNTRKALRAYGDNLGIAFQIADDILDYRADQAALGKTIGDDFREGKITLPVIVAFARADDTEKAFWHRTMEKGDQRDGDLEEALAVMAGRGAIDEAIEIARSYEQAALDALDATPEGPARDALAAMASFAVERLS